MIAIISKDPVRRETARWIISMDYKYGSPSLPRFKNTVQRIETSSQLAGRPTCDSSRTAPSRRTAPNRPGASG
jgi:hypothetical protein